MSRPIPTIILASASPARMETLQNAGVDPQVIVSGVDETGIGADSVSELVASLAELKATAVHDQLLDLPGGERRPRVVIGCDSLLEFEGLPFGKPGSLSAVVERWRRMRGRCGVLRTGHHLLVDGAPGTNRTVVRNKVASATVYFAAVDDDEIEAYAATGEPAQVAGGFTIDGLGGPLIERIEGDPHTVVGISLPLLRAELRSLGLGWPAFGG
ncbi:Maf family protein [Naumannella halotolerans]|uniref:Maf family protein n=1 Tax=Naumannella halotolerans TaxID=993414 RepID=UPI00370D5286